MAQQINHALIGYTGFVGSTLLRSQPYDMLFNSSNIKDIKGHHFTSVTCAGVSAAKWLANKEPEQDRLSIDSLIEPLKYITADKFILISTVDVYADPNDVTESDIPDTDAAQPYGRHRRELEQWVLERFEDALVVRLPALFGEGLKKNILYDFLHLNQTEKINPNSSFQWYPMRRFAMDLRCLIDCGASIVNVAVEPIATSEIASGFFPRVAMGHADAVPVKYNVKTRFASVLGGSGDYHLTRETVLQELGVFIESQT
jgi:hypothetical protein